MSSIESHLSNKPKQFFFNPINIFDTFTHSITLLYIFNKLFSFNVNFLMYSCCNVFKKEERVQPTKVEHEVVAVRVVEKVPMANGPKKIEPPNKPKQMQDKTSMIY